MKKVIISGGSWSDWFNHSNYLDRDNCEGFTVKNPKEVKNCFCSFFYSCRMAIFREELKFKDNEGKEVRLYGFPTIDKIKELKEEMVENDRILLLTSNPKMFHEMCETFGKEMPIEIFNGFDPSPKELRIYIKILFPDKFDILTEEFLKALKSRLRFQPGIASVVLNLLLESGIKSPTVQDLTKLGITNKVHSNLTIFMRYFEWGFARKPMWYKLMNKRFYSLKYLAKIWINYLNEIELVYLEDRDLRLSEYRRTMYESLISNIGFTNLMLLRKSLKSVKSNISFLAVSEEFIKRFNKKRRRV